MLDVLGDAVADHLDTTALHALLDGEAATKAPAVSKKPRTGRTTVTFSRTTGASTAVDLRHHGDAEVAPGMLDFAVNVLVPPPPAWLHDALSRQLTQLAAYPDPTAARAAAARHHGIGPEQVLPTNGAAEAFSLIARARPWRHPVVVHPQFTEPEAALAAAGHAVARVVLDVAQGFALDVAAVPDDADLVVVDNPTNPTSVLHPRAALERLRRPGRVLRRRRGVPRRHCRPGRCVPRGVPRQRGRRRRPEPDQELRAGRPAGGIPRGLDAAGRGLRRGATTVVGQHPGRNGD